MADEAGPGPPRFRVPVRDLLAELAEDPRFAPNIRVAETLPATPARHAPWPDALAPALVAAAGALGIEALYSHQAAAVGAALAGSHVVQAAGTASGKSLGYLLPVLDRLIRDPSARALLLFPTKALAQDQLQRLLDWDRALPAAGLRPATYDGDTPSGRRAGIRREARIILTNPDMLHAGLLPRHPAWLPFFAGLGDVVIDEMHVYRGVFGSHVANVLRRLRRVARFHGAQPRFHLTSATIANPAELGRALAGEAVTVIEDDGAPRGRRSFLLYNPPLVDTRLNLRRGAVLEAASLARHFLEGGVQTIVFAHTRQRTELLLRYLGEGTVREADGAGVPRPVRPLPGVRAYRGGYTPGERRAIERGLRDGAIRGVVATNALELGIDIGGLDACVIAGYPGTIASTWQQAGRAGRRAEDAVAIFVAGGAPLDQFMVRHPDYFFGRSPEHARLDPDNLRILVDHLRCAVFELPFDAEEAGRPFGEAPDPLQGPRSDAAGAGTAAGAWIAPEAASTASRPSAGELLGALAAAGEVRQAGGAWYWLGEAHPAGEVGLRGAGTQTVAIVLRRAGADAVEDEDAAPAGTSGSARAAPAGTSGSARAAPAGTSGSARAVPGPGVGAGGEGGWASPAEGEAQAASAWELLGTVEASAAPAMLHPGAVYLHDGRAYRVEQLDLEAGRALVSPTDGSIYTRSGGRTELVPVALHAERAAPGVRLAEGELEVTRRVTGYRMIRFSTQETVGWGEVDLPEQRHLAAGYWFTLDEATVEGLRAIGTWRHDPLSDRGPNWRAQALRARERDGFRCRMCAAPERPGRVHDVHHIRPFRQFGWRKGQNEHYRLANDLDNLITLCPGCHRVAERALGLHGGLTGLGYALAHLAPLFLMCDPRDLGVTAESHAAWTGRPTVAVYEQVAGGVGFGAALFELHERLIAAAIQLVEDCPCAQGCPACVGPAEAPDADAKAHALAVLRAIG